MSSPEEDEQQQCSVRENHPLENPLIIDAIFRHRRNTLASVQIHRLVCKAWKEASNSQWNALAPLTVLQDPEYGPLEEGTTSIRQILEEQENNQNIPQFPHRHLRLRHWNINIDHYDSSSDSVSAGLNQRFWGLCGQNITTLTLSRCKIPYNLTLIPLVFWRVVPNLENLNLTNCVMEAILELGLPQIDTLNGKIFTLERNTFIEDLCIARLYAQLKQRDQTPNFAMLWRQIQEHANKISDIRSELGSLFLERNNKHKQLMLKLQEEACNLASNPVKLRALRVHNLEYRNTDFRGPIEWSNMMSTFPNLERVSVLMPLSNVCEYGECGDVVERKLKKLELMVDDFDQMMPEGTIWKLPTEKLSLDFGFKTDHERIVSILEHQADNLSKLVLFRAPFGVAFPSFPCAMAMPNLFKLYLWGNVSANMNFLKLTPNLKSLKWNTTCYDDKTRGARLHKRLFNTAHYPIFAQGIVEGTDGLGDGFILTSLETLELVSGTLSLSSLAKLGNWFPNLKNFKATVVGGDELATIRNQWLNLERLELAHGSVVTAEQILSVYTDHEGFQKLKSFTWKSCPCKVRDYGVFEMCAERALRKTAGDNVVHPWKTEEEMFNEPTENKTCLQELFQQAVIHGGEKALEFLQLTK